MLNLIKQILTSEPYSIRITDNFMQLIQFSGQGNKLTINSYGHLELPSGLIQHGSIQKPKEVAAKLKSLLTSTKPKQVNVGSNCAICIPDEKCFYQVLEFDTALKGKDLEAAIKDQIENKIPVPYLELKYDYNKVIINNKQYIFVVAIKRENIAEYYEITKQLNGLKLVFMEPETLSLARNFKMKRENNLINAIVNIDQQIASWSLMINNQIWEQFYISKQKFDLDPNKFVETTSNSLLILANKLKIEAVEIFVSCPENELDKIKQVLQSKIPNTNIDANNFKIALKNQASALSVINGLALKATNWATGDDINLLKS